MASSYPSGLDSLTNPSSEDKEDSVTVPHAAQHARANDAVEALEAKLGINSSAVATSIDYFLKHSSGAYRTHLHDGTSDDGANITVDGLADDAVETAKIKDANVTAGKLATDSVETAKIKDANVTAAKLATDSVETDKVKDDNVTEGKLADGVFIPIGGIILWSGAIVDIPTNWALCDGTNSTPDLTDRFVVGAGDTYAVDNSGGFNTINLAHTHTSGTLKAKIRIDNQVTDQLILNQSSSSNWTPNYRIPQSNLASTSTTQSGAVNTLGSTASALSTTQNNRPPYYALAYIMRTA